MGVRGARDEGPATLDKPMKQAGKMAWLLLCSIKMVLELAQISDQQHVCLACALDAYDVSLLPASLTGCAGVAMPALPALPCPLRVGRDMGAHGVVDGHTAPRHCLHCF